MMMILKVFERLFNIDDIDCKWSVRFMFLFCVLSRCAVFFNPYSDTDFSWLNAWMNNYESADQTQRFTMDVPFTSGNVVFLVTAFIGINFLVEIIGNLVVDPVIYKSVRHLAPRIKKPGRAPKKEDLYPGENADVATCPDETELPADLSDAKEYYDSKKSDEQD